MKVLNYKVMLHKELEGGYTVTVPSLPGCITYGETIEESLTMVREAIEGYIESLKGHGEDIPSDDGVLEYNLSISSNEQYSFTLAKEANQNHRIERIYSRSYQRKPSNIL